MNYRIEIESDYFKVFETEQDADGKEIFDSLGAARAEALDIARIERSYWSDRVTDIRTFNLSKVIKLGES